MLRQQPADGAGIRPGIIAVFADTASGDAQPLYTIEGSATQLNMPNGRYFSGIGFDPYTSRIMVSNPGSSAANNRVLLFNYTAGVGGNLAPARILEGTNVSRIRSAFRSACRRGRRSRFSGMGFSHNVDRGQNGSALVQH